tara:strand:- start:4911 stop:6419 length:1509 start_codon:yes stop_codon:yes gene_type:complete
MTDIPEKVKEELEEICMPIINGAVSLRKVKENTGYFAYHNLGVTPRLWQYYFWKKLDADKKRIMAVTSRQIGKSMAIAIFALKAAAYNLKPAGLGKKTHIGIISATEDQSHKLMQEIRRLIQIGDQQVNLLTKNKVQKFYSSMIDTSQEARNNMGMMTFRNGNTITCLPPTGKIRGNSFSYVFIDEAPHIDNNDLFHDEIEPTTANTRGNITMTGTPNGQQGWFFELFDPFDRKEDNIYERIWFDYTILEDQDIIDSIEAKKKQFAEEGRSKHFEQEYMAKFTSQVSAFFDSSDVDKMFDSNLTRMENSLPETDMGIDFGMVHSNTVITISEFREGKVYRKYHYEYGHGQDLDVIKDILDLKDRFNCQRINVDDCPEGHYIILDLEKRGINLTKMTFRTEKVSKYMSFRSKLKQSLILSYPDRELEAQMKGLQQQELATHTKITKPSGGKDDLVDSFLLSCYHFLDMEEDFEVVAVGLPPRKEEVIGTRRDIQWENLRGVVV